MRDFSNDPRYSFSKEIFQKLENYFLTIGEFSSAEKVSNILVNFNKLIMLAVCNEEKNESIKKIIDKILSTEKGRFLHQNVKYLF